MYSEKSVKKLVARLKKEYDAVLATHREETEELKEENRQLRARLSVLEGERGTVSDALVHAVREGERIREESEKSLENEKKELLLLMEKCRLLSERLTKKYPDAEDTLEFAAFTAELAERMGESTPEPQFDMDEVIAPKGPLDLGQLCRDLGLMEEDE